MTIAITGTPSANFSGWRGININHPFASPSQANAAPGYYFNQDVSALYSPTWSAHVSGAQLDALVAAGFDHVRLVVVPGPLVDCIINGNTTRFDQIMAVFFVAVDAMLAKGLSVNFDMHPSQTTSNPYDYIELLDGLSGVNFTAYKASLARVAGLIGDSYTPQQVALSIYNEPPSSVSNSDWNAYALALYTAARAANPVVTLIIPGPSFSSLFQFENLNVATDINALFEFHAYEPSTFCKQGNGEPDSVAGSDPIYWIQDLPWPPVPGGQVAAQAAADALINASALSAGNKVIAKAYVDEEFDVYFGLDQNVEYMVGLLSNVVEFQTARSVIGDRIYCGEFGVNREENNGPIGDFAAVWMNFMTGYFQAKGWRCAVFSYDSSDFGITNGAGIAIGTINPAKQAGLNLRRGKIVLS